MSLPSDRDQTNSNSTVPSSTPTLKARLVGLSLLPFGALSVVGFPSGSIQANWFSFFNAISWQIALGAPVILYAQKLGAGDAMLGLLAALSPLLVIMQIPGAHLLPRFGYRRVMLSGWLARTIILFVLASSPLWLGTRSGRLAAVMIGLTLFNFFRGLTGGAWMPWVTELIPHSVRGRFFSQQQIFSQIGGLIALGIVSILLLGKPAAGQFVLTLLLSALGGAASLLFLAGTPDISAPHLRAQSGARVPWIAMIRFRPFFRLCVFNILLVLAMGGLGVFTVAFLRGVEGFSESSIVLLSAMAVIGGLVSLLWSGPLMDRVSSGLIIRLGMLIFALIFAGWWMVAARIVPDPSLVVGALFGLSGIANINLTVANFRLQSATIPMMGRNHFFALFTVITSLAAAFSPIVWGLLLDAIGTFSAATGPLLWNRYSIYFAIAFVLLLPTIFYSRYLIETPQPGSILMAQSD